jgi:ABC-type branched-subunit amino acid transport system ATPase component/predicted MFS family arabinose efflux permease
MPSPGSTAQPDARDLVASMLLEEQRRHEEQARRQQETLVVSDDLLLGIGGDEMSLRQVLSVGGWATIGVLFGLGLIDAIDNAAFGVLAPNIQESLHLSDGGIGIVGALAGLTLFVAAIPLGVLGGRVRRTAVAGFSTMLWAVAALFTGLSQMVWQLVAVRVIAGIGKANEGPIQSSLLVDAYPPEGRGRIFAIQRIASPAGIIIGPLLAGGIAALAGGDDGWRWAFVCLAVPAGLLGLVALALREPERGRYDRIAAKDHETGLGDSEPPIAISAAFARLKKIKTFYFIMSALGAFGFAVTTVPIYLNLIMRDEFGLSAGQRGLVGSISSVGGIIGAVIGGRYADRLFRVKPELTMWLSGGALAALGLGFGVQAYAPNVVVFTAIGVISQGLLFAGLVPASPVVAAVTPYRLRTLSFALVGLYLSLVGGLGGALIVAGLADAHGPQMAVAIVAPISSLVAGALVAYASRYLRSDIAAAVADVIEERDERDRVAAGGELPILQVRHLDFSYGQVQVLFDVNVDVRRGEVLALLGTNGAGKSTLLRTISGLAPPDRGVIRLSGRTLTFADPVTRVRAGIVQVPGGRSVYPSLSVRENLLARGYTMLSDTGRLQERVNSVLELFPVLAIRLDQRAGSLSGGEQQMLGIATALLLEPEVLLIDELSLGLAPVVVQQLLEVIERLKALGMTIVIVEQSVNVALSIADRAVFMEKGQVRFEGAAADLLERDDLIRAVFLGKEGG